MIGMIFGQLTVLDYAGLSKNKHKLYRCVCSCGKEKTIFASNLRKGNSKTCGCVGRSKCSIRMSKLNLRHGETNTKLWRTWRGILERTTIETSNHYGRYGAKGIGVCQEWMVYENFAKQVGHPPSDKHSIDRIDNNKGYFPGNVRWATAKEQAHNRSTNIRVCVDGQIMVCSEAAKKLNVSKSTVSRWVKIGKLKKIEQ